MPVTYINRRKDKYYLHESKTKKGNPKYYFSKSYTGKLSDRIPNGYEIYENPNAQVFLRKKMPKFWKDTEIRIIEKSIKKNSAVYDYRINVRRNILTFSPMMRLILIDTDKRIFTIERCYFAGEGGWLFLDSGPDLKKLADEFCQHLGRDSFFQLL